MLVLSRKKNQSVVFPNLGIEVVVQRIVGNSVSVGITAPKAVQILRGELVEHSGQANAGLAPVGKALSPTDAVHPNNELLHSLRNQLNKAQLAVALAQKKLKMGQSDNAEQILNEMLSQLQAIDQQVEPVAQRAQEPVAAATAGIQRQSLNKRALLVEDDANERALLAGYLRLCGFTVDEAGDGLEALEFLDHKTVDLVILDMRMPRMNGAETAKAIRSRPRLRDVKILVVSGEDRGSMHEDEAPVDAEWFAKPLNPDRLARYFESAISPSPGLAI